MKWKITWPSVDVGSKLHPRKANEDDGRLDPSYNILDGFNPLPKNQI